MSALHLTIPDPCHENWQQMTPNQQGRYCGSCEKTVVDFTQLSDQEVLLFMRQATSRVCGRFHDHQLNKIYSDAKVRPPYSFGYGWSVLIGVLLLSGNTATAQMGVIATRPLVNAKRTARDFWSIARAVDKPSLQEMAVAYAQKTRRPPAGMVGMTGMEEIVELEMTTGVVLSDTIVHVPCPASVQLPAAIDTTGPDIAATEPAGLDIIDAFENDVVPADTAVATDSAVVCDLDHIFTGKVVVKVEESKVEQLKRSVQEWLPGKKQLTVYPNPVSGGQSIKVELALKESGSYRLELLDAGGRLMHVQAVPAIQGQQVLAMPTQSSWAGGIYWLRVTGNNDKKMYQAKLVIQ